MTVAEVIILIVGAILFTVSFFIPDKGGKDASGGVDREDAKIAVRDAVDEEMKRIKETIQEASEESISDNKDKMERYMDRITNEKMMAVSEYSDTVLEQIHKDHQEAVFLYDMIDSKYTQVKSTAAEINQIEKSVKRLSSEMPVAKAEVEKVQEKPAAVNMPKQPVETVKKTEEKPVNKKDDFNPIPAEVVEVEMAASEKKEVEETKAAPTEKKKRVKKQEPNIVETPAANPAEIELMFDSDSNSMNNNDRILALHKEGKSNMAIAKELGLGVGEVKLVIDLFKS